MQSTSPQGACNTAGVIGSEFMKGLLIQTATKLRDLGAQNRQQTFLAEVFVTDFMEQGRFGRKLEGW